MAGYTPIFRSILQSTIWEEEAHVKVVWLTMLLMCDRNGFVDTTISGLARAAVVTREQCINAIGRLSSPDKESKSKALEGRRVIQVDDGYQLVNHQKYKDKMGLSSRQNRERVASFRRNKSPVAKKTTENSPEDSNTSVPCNGCNGNTIGIDLGLGLDLGLKSSSETKKLPRVKKTKSPSVCSPAPESITATEATLKIAKEFNRDWQSDWEACRDWAWSKGETRADWQATLRTWMKKATTFQAGKTRAYSRPPVEKWGLGRGNGPQPNDPLNPIIPNRVELTEEDYANASNS